jgi:general stress protein 26
MKVLIQSFVCFLASLCVSCSSEPKSQPESGNREQILNAAREIIQASGKCALITLDDNNLPQVRTMDPFEPETNFTIWLATNPKSRKVNQIKNNPNVTLYYSDKKDNGYVSIYGIAELVIDDKEKEKRWKEEWEEFYPNRSDDYLLIKIAPTRLEVINYSAGISGNPDTWQPAVVYFNE